MIGSAEEVDDWKGGVGSEANYSGIRHAEKVSRPPKISFMIA